MREEVRDVVAAVAQGRLVEGQQPEAVDAQPLQVVEPARSSPSQVTLAVAVGVGEPADEHLVEDGLLVPPGVALVRGASRQLIYHAGRRSPRGTWSNVMESQQYGRPGPQPMARNPGRAGGGGNAPRRDNVLDITIRRPATAVGRLPSRRRSDHERGNRRPGHAPPGCATPEPWSSTSGGSSRFDRPGLAALIGVLRRVRGTGRPGRHRRHAAVDGAVPAVRGPGPALPDRAGARGAARLRGVSQTGAATTGRRGEPAPGPTGHDARTTTWETSPGGLVRAMLSVLHHRRRRVGGWVGTAGDDAGAVRARRRPTACPSRCRPGRSPEFYDGFSNDTLWPLYHDAIRTSTFEPRLVGRLRRGQRALRRRPPPRRPPRAPSSGCTTTSCSSSR